MKTIVACLLAACLTLSAAPLTLRWKADDKATSYELYGSTNQSQWVLLVATTNTAVTVNLQPAVWQFYVAGVNYWGKSEPGTIVTSLPPAVAFRTGITGVESPLPVKVQVQIGP